MSTVQSAPLTILTHFVRQHVQTPFRFMARTFSLVRVGILHTQTHVEYSFLACSARHCFCWEGHTRRPRTSGHTQQLFFLWRTPPPRQYLFAMPDMVSPPTISWMHTHNSHFLQSWRLTTLFRHAWIVDRKLLKWLKARSMASSTA